MVLLRNLGQTCCINSLLQVLSHLNYNISLFPKTSNETLSFHLLKLIYLMRNNPNKIIRPELFINKFFESLTCFERHEQIDIQELYTVLSYKVFQETSVKIERAPQSTDTINSQIYLHNEGRTSPWNDIFQGVLATIIVCKNCSCKNEVYEPFYSITVSPSTNMKTSLSQFFEKDSYCDDDWECSKCKNKKYIKYVRFIKVPQYLFINMYRYNNQNEKDNREMVFPKSIRLSPNVKIDNVNSIILTKQASICHRGTATNGHYYTIIEDDIFDDDTTYKNKDNLHDRFIYMTVYKASYENVPDLSDSFGLLNTNE